ncbi:MAG: transposase [Aridibacter famidurans]|nr:transposase [Aridibacter famidurans]
MGFDLFLKNGKAPSGGEERSGTRTDGGAPASVEVPAKAVRRTFTAEYKRSVVEEAERSTEPGEIGALLRREGLYSSQLAKWRQLYREGALKGLKDDKRGRRKKPKNPLEGRLRELERENRRLQKKLRQAEVIIDVQKKVAAIMADPTLEDDEDDW